MKLNRKTLLLSSLMAASSCFALGDNVGGVPLTTTTANQATNISCEQVPYTPRASNEELKQVTFDNFNNYWVIGRMGLYYFSNDNQFKYSFDFHGYGQGVAWINAQRLAVSSNPSSIATYDQAKMLIDAANGHPFDINIDSGYIYQTQSLSNVYSGDSAVGNLFYQNGLLYAQYLGGGGRHIYQWKYNSDFSGFDPVSWLSDSNYATDPLTEYSGVLYGVINTGSSSKLTTCSTDSCKVDNIMGSISQPSQPLFINGALYTLSLASGVISETSGMGQPKYSLVDKNGTQIQSITQSATSSSNRNQLYVLTKNNIYRCPIGG